MVFNKKVYYGLYLLGLSFLGFVFFLIKKTPKNNNNKNYSLGLKQVISSTKIEIALIIRRLLWI